VWPVHGSTVDLTMAGGRSSSELGLAGAPGHGGLPRRHRRQEGGAGTLAVGSPWAKRRQGGLAAVESRTRRWRSVCVVLGERRVGVWCGEVEAGAALYRLREGGPRPFRWGMVGGGAV
jgi:hypothetical protein